MGTELHLANANVDFRVYGEEKFKITAPTHNGVAQEMNGIGTNLEQQLQFPVAEAADRLDSATDQLLVLQQLIELFGAPDTSSPLVMSTYLLLQSHEQRLTEALHSAELEIRERLDQVRKILKAQLLSLAEEEKKNALELQQLNAEFTQINAPRSDVVVNVSALNGDLAPFANQEGVSRLTTSIEQKKGQLMAKIMNAQAYSEYILAQREKAIQGLSILVSAWRQVGAVTTLYS